MAGPALALLLGATLLALAPGALGTSLNVSAGQRFCLSQEVTPGAILASSFAVTAGGDLKVRVTATADRQGEFYRTDAVTDGSFTLQDAPGKVTVCYHNDDPREDKTVAIYWLESRPTDEGAASKPQADYVATSLERLQTSIFEAAEQQKFFQQSEGLHRTLLARLASRLNFWAVVKCLTVAGCAAYQVMIVKKHFGKRRTAV